MNTVSEYTVLGMTCEHCVRAVTAEVRTIEDVIDVRVDLRPGEPSTVTIVSSGPVDPYAVEEAIDLAGYELARRGGAD